MTYPRDLAGYGRTPPDPKWPGGKKLAVQFVINYEEGGEHSVLHGDRQSEAFLTEEPTVAFPNIRNINVESQYEYGSRVGWWRLYRLFTERKLPVTIFGIAASLQKNPEAVAAMKEANFEIASHGLRWIQYAEMPEEQEAAQIAEAIRIHTEVTGSRPTGWYTGRMSVNTRRLLVEAGGFTYDADSFADDLPYWVEVNGQDHLVVPYTLDNNDGRYVNTYGYQSPSFSAYLIQAFDFLRWEAEVSPRMMSIGLHTRIVGRPGRAADLERFLDHVAAADDVWVTRRIDIADHWRANHPPRARR
ncbi:allantoinase PuuE [Mesorhizobium sp. 1B3]|uniref:allantoinase PuuE n=1 Tax=Mesorhizobium sp. 1B3 TaxID=3243599 RepID=UPI003D962F26